MFAPDPPFEMGKRKNLGRAKKKVYFLAYDPPNFSIFSSAGQKSKF